MTSTFVWNGNSNQLKADIVTPTMLKRIFGIENIMLTDEEGNVHFDEGDKFDPPLSAETSYTLSQIFAPAMQSNENADKDKQVVALIKNAETSLHTAVSGNNFVSENTGLLLNAIHAPFLINVIAVLSCLGPDPSLISKNMAFEAFKVLTTPGSFKASLSQLAHSICGAYGTADHSMNGIKTLLSDLPDYLARIFKLINDTNLGENGQKTLKKQLAQVNTTNEKCKKYASDAHKSVAEVIKLLNELYQASLALNSANASEIRENEARKIVLTMEQNDRSKGTAELEKKAAESEKSRNEAKKAHLDQINSNSVLINIVGATMAEGAMDYVNGVCAREAFKLASKVITENVLSEVVTNVTKDDPGTLTKELAQLQTLDIGTHTTFKTPEAIISKISYIKEFEKNIFTTPEGISLKRKVTEFREFLENNPTQISEETLNSSLQGVKTSLSNAMDVLAKISYDKQMQQQKNKEAQLNLHQQIVKSDAEKTQTTQKFYEKECENAEKIRKELAENKDRMREIIIELQNVTVSVNDLTGCIQFLEKVLRHLSQIEENWSSLERFFDRISTCVENILHRHVKEFADHVEDNFSTENMLESAMNATACIIQVSNCAEIYMATSKTLIMPVIGGINRQLVLSPGEAKVKQLDIQTNLSEAHRNLEELVDDKQREFNERVTEQIADFVNKIKNALPSQQIGN